MTQTATETLIPRDPEPTVVLIDPPGRGTNRSYDFNAGDERRFQQSEAMARAQVRVKDRGCRQQVRLDGPALLGGPRLWLVQDL